ncbi:MULTISPECIES: sarcosine oxidase subunit gamma [Stutzerimonas]|uniref:sarcosine oxidase subunit gamma n=1 Tax=Stutzerimonas TaxID=2901164 RepID=UPI00241ED22A|nr:MULTISPECIES: sarcosine oxidase [Stutzerimonas]
MNVLKVEMCKERSPLYPKQTDAVHARLGETVLVSRFAVANEAETLARCGLVDLTNLARVGFRGTDAADYLQHRNYRLPEAPNRALAQLDGSLVARLSQTEYLLLGSLHDGGSRIQAEENRWALGAKALYLLPRQDSHAWLLLSGEHASQVMAKLCGVDLRAESFAEGAVAQTSAARINVIVINAPIDGLPGYHILCDRSSVSYFWDVLLDAMSEFAGKPVGIEALLDR